MIKGIIFDFGYTLYDPKTNQLYPQVIEILEKLSGNYKMAVASRTEDPEKRRILIRNLGLEKYFTVIEIITEGENKDLQQILTQLNLIPEEILVVGDRLTSEITQGKKLGMQTCRYLNGPEKDLEPKNDLEKPDHTISKLEELYGYLN